MDAKLVFESFMSWYESLSEDEREKFCHEIIEKADEKFKAINAIEDGLQAKHGKLEVATERFRTKKGALDKGQVAYIKRIKRKRTKVKAIHGKKEDN